MGQACSSGTDGGIDFVGPVELCYFGLDEKTMLKARFLAIWACAECGGLDYTIKPIMPGDWFGGKVDKLGLSPFGYLCVVKLPDGTRITETTACLLTVGKVTGLLGQGTKDQGTSYMLACKAAEMFTDFTSKGPTMFTVQDFKGDKPKAFEDWKTNNLAPAIDQLEKLCSADGKFTSALTAGEIAVWACLHQMKGAECSVNTTPGKLATFYNRMEALPGIKKILAGQSKGYKTSDYAVPVPK